MILWSTFMKTLPSNNTVTTTWNCKCHLYYVGKIVVFCLVYLKCSLCSALFSSRVNEAPVRTQIVELVSCTAAIQILQCQGQIRLLLSNSCLLVRCIWMHIKNENPYLCSSHQVQNHLTCSKRSVRRTKRRNGSGKPPTRNFSPLYANRTTIRVMRRAVMTMKKRSFLKKVVCSFFSPPGALQVERM